METLSANSSADDELDKLFSMVYGDQDQLEVLASINTTLYVTILNF